MTNLGGSGNFDTASIADFRCRKRPYRVIEIHFETFGSIMCKINFPSSNSALNTLVILVSQGENTSP